MTSPPQNDDEVIYPYSEVFNWASNLSAEQNIVFVDDYIWSKEIRNLLRRIRVTSNNMVAVIGNQGSGKTAARDTLTTALNEKRNLKVYSFKWGDPEKIYEKIADVDTTESIRNRILLSEQSGLKQPKLYNPYGTHLKDFPASTLVDRYFDVLSRSAKLKLIWEALINAASSEKVTFLIEFQDFDKKSRGHMIKQLEEFRNFWDEITGEHETSFNAVIFFQRELWGGHFMFGKFEVIELKPFTPEQLKNHYIQLFGSSGPFTEDALIYLAGLARGIVRWFKKYVKLCLEYYYDEFELMRLNRDYVEPVIEQKLVKQWITLTVLAEDWERELMDAFPKSNGLRKKAVEVIRYIFENGEKDQKQIQFSLYGKEGDDKTACSRMIAKLEEYGYITRTLRGRDKVIKLVNHYD